jgi:hypothetical protein
MERSKSPVESFTSNHVLFEPAFVRAGAWMANKFKEMSAEEFLDPLPKHPARPTVDFALFRKLAAEMSLEINMYDPFVGFAYLGSLLRLIFI